MAGILVKAASIIPLFHQLGDYDTGLFVEAIVKDDSGNAYVTVDLVDRGDGMYTNKTVAMPSKNLIVTFKTYEDIGKTIISNDQAGTDIFILDVFTEATRRDDKIIGIVETNDQISGTLETAEVIAILNSPETVAVLEGDENLVSIFDDDELTATFKCL